jgi:PAS domain S-box-containing protein
VLKSFTGKGRAMKDNGKKSGSAGNNGNGVESIKLIQTVLREAPIGVFLLGGDARIMYANREASRDLGYSNKELTGKYVWDIDPSYDMKRFSEEMSELRKKGVLKTKIIGISKSGRPIMTEVTFNSIKSDGKDCCIAFAEDVGSVKIDKQKWARLNVLVEALDSALSKKADSKA